MELPISDWPITAMEDVTVKIPERKTQSGSVLFAHDTNEIGIDQIITITKYSSFTRLKRVLAWIMKACEKFKGSVVEHSLPVMKFKNLKNQSS